MSGFFHGPSVLNLPALPCLRLTANGEVLLDLHVMPNAAKTGVDGLYGQPGEEALKLRLKAPPVEGKANQALLRWLADTLDITQTSITLVRGKGARRKQLRIAADAAATADWQALQPPLKG
jgi:uncharacterized protein (TIGR00251 family)